MIYKRYKLGRLRSDREGPAEIVHAVVADADPGYGSDKALCGTRPSKRSVGWSGYEMGAVTCAKCRAKMDGATDYTMLPTREQLMDDKQMAADLREHDVDLKDPRTGYSINVQSTERWNERKQAIAFSREHDA